MPGRDNTSSASRTTSVTRCAIATTQQDQTNTKALRHVLLLLLQAT